MKKLISALWLISTLATGAAWAQPYAPNDAGVTNGHWHLNSRDVAANKHILLGMGGVATGPGERVVVPGVLVILTQGPTTPPTPAPPRARQKYFPFSPWAVSPPGRVRGSCSPASWSFSIRGLPRRRRP